MDRDKKLHVFLLAGFLCILTWSFINCFDLLTWILEAAPAIVGVIILIAVYHKFRLTNLAFILVWLHAIVLLVGAHYTYSKMPLFDWLKDTFELSRNHYDRFGHIAQGFVPAILAREVLLRTSPLRRGKWLFFIIICICLAIAAAYELFEWLVAILIQEDSIAFLAMQGDIWDTHKDMALCLISAIAALVTLGKLHDKALKKLSAD
ncbi:MAG: DUF2238 domain-containing protein [Planctomycetes bacterium]|nr:DUF2238 domain-containing protein [Planctomycetota bacterium]